MDLTIDRANDIDNALAVQAPKRRRAPRALAYTPETQRPPAVARTKVACSSEVYAEVSFIHDALQEHLVCLDVNTRNQVIERRVVAIGTLNGVEVHPRDVYRGAILNNAAAVILVHNHPSGDPTPSRQDLELTRRIIEGGKLLGIPCLDHVVVARHGFVGLAQSEYARSAGFGS